MPACRSKAARRGEPLARRRTSEAFAIRTASALGLGGLLGGGLLGRGLLVPLDLVLALGLLGRLLRGERLGSLVLLALGGFLRGLLLLLGLALLRRDGVQPRLLHGLDGQALGLDLLADLLVLPPALPLGQLLGAAVDEQLHE